MSDKERYDKIIKKIRKRGKKNKRKNKKKQVDINNDAKIFNFISDMIYNKNEVVEVVPTYKSNNNFLSFIDNMLLDIENEKKQIIQHKTEKEFKIDFSKKYDILSNDINNIDDLINIAKKYKNSKKNFSFNIKKLFNLIEPLKELKNIIGMNDVKKNILNQILFFLQNFDSNDMLHTVIQGPPGVGKTYLGIILSKIYYNLGIIKGCKNKSFTNPINGEKQNFNFKIVKRADLIGQYLGHTAIKTQKVIDECEGGVLFIDEAYSLGNNDSKDNYSKECIDTINQNLSENSGKFVCIIAGYPDKLEECFFSQNEGLRRRFPFVYNIEKYNSNELTDIFIKKVKDSKWKLDKDLFLDKTNLYKFIEKNYDYFKYFGGDIETLFLNCKICHSVRIFGKDPKLRKILNYDDILNGFSKFTLHKNKKELENNITFMYS